MTVAFLGGVGARIPGAGHFRPQVQESVAAGKPSAASALPVQQRRRIAVRLLPVQIATGELL